MSELRLSLRDAGGQGHCALRLGYWKLVLNQEGGSHIPELLLRLRCFAGWAYLDEDTFSGDISRLTEGI